MTDDAVTLWLSNLAGGDQQAAARIWQQYYDRLVHLARKKLDGLPRRGYTSAEIAAQFGITERSIERKLERVRKIWGQRKSERDSSTELSPPLRR